MLYIDWFNPTSYTGLLETTCKNSVSDKSTVSGIQLSGLRLPFLDEKMNRSINGQIGKGNKYIMKQIKCLQIDKQTD